MAKYLCKNKTKCSNADDFIDFTPSGSGKPVCPVCGSDNLKMASGGVGPVNVGGDGSNDGQKFLLIALAFLAIIGVAGGAWYVWEKPDSTTGISTATTPTNPSIATPANPNPPVATTPPPTPPLQPPHQNIPPVPPELPAHPELCGVIEIGATGVKGVVVDLVKSETDPKCQVDEEVFSNCVIRKKLEPSNVNPIEAGAVEDAAKAAKVMQDEMTNRYAVDLSQIYLVGSSSVADVSHRDRLKQTIENALGKPGLMGFVTAGEEAGYAFQGVLHLVPKTYRDKRKSKAVVLDIGSGNTKGAYMEVMGEEKRLIDFAIPWGTKKFTKQVDNQRGDGSFKDASARLRQGLLLPEIREVVERKQGMAMHDRVYLLGGISWALANFIQPKNTQHFPRVFPEHIETLYNNAIRPNARRKLCDENPQRTEEIDRICQTFDVNNIIAGMDLLKTFSEEMKFKDKTVFFMRDSLYAWPLGYLKARCQAEGKC